MKLGFVIILNIAVFLLFIKTHENLHVLEIITYYFLYAILSQNFLALRSELVFHVIELSNQLDLYWIIILNRLILVPTLSIFFMNFYVSIKKKPIKILCILIAPIFLLAGDGWLNTSLHAIEYIHWKLWWSYPVMLGILLISVVFMKIFRKMLSKVGI